MIVRCQLLLVTLAVHTAVGVTTNTQIHQQPWLERSPAKVLKLDCEPHPSKLSDLSELRLSFRSETNGSQDKTLAKITDINVKLNEDPTDSQYTPDDAQITFEGKWDEKKMSIATACLRIVMPITKEKYGAYSCVAKYRNDEIWTNITVDQYTISKREGENFEVTITKVDKIMVTWKLAKSEFVEARVWHTRLDKISGQEIMAPPKTLFATIGEKDPLYNDKVLLHKFRSPPKKNTNYSLLMYIDSTLCGRACRYSCNVPYDKCIGSDARLCECCLVLHDGYSSECTATDPEDSHKIPFFVCLSILILIIIVCVLIYIFRSPLKDKITVFCSRLKCCDQNPSSNDTNDPRRASSHAEEGDALVPINESGSNEDGNGRSRPPISNQLTDQTIEHNQAQDTSGEHTSNTNESREDIDMRNMISQHPISDHTPEPPTVPTHSQGTVTGRPQVSPNECGSSGSDNVNSQHPNQK